MDAREDHAMAVFWWSRQGARFSGPTTATARHSWVTVIVADLVLGILASIIVMAFSRQRELRADRGGASLAGRGAMIAAPAPPGDPASAAAAQEDGGLRHRRQGRGRDQAPIHDTRRSRRALPRSRQPPERAEPMQPASPLVFVRGLTDLQRTCGDLSDFVAL